MAATLWERPGIGPSARPEARQWADWSRAEGGESLLACRFGGRGKPIRVIQKTVLFFKDVKSELSQVSWPTWRELFESTKVVLATMLLLALAVGFIDLVCARLISWIIH